MTKSEPVVVRRITLTEYEEQVLNNLAAEKGMSGNALLKQFVSEGMEREADRQQPKSPRERLKTIGDEVLAKAVLKMKMDRGYWDQHPAVFEHTRKGYEALGRKLSRGVREVVNRVEADGIEAHLPLKRIFDAVAPLKPEELRNPHRLFEAMRNLPEPQEQPKPRYPF
jgi:hypothetical protein